MPQVRTHAVAQNRAVVVGAEPALDQRVPRAAQGVALADAADELHRVAQRAHLIVGQGLLGHHVDRLRLFLDRYIALARRAGLRRRVALILSNTTALDIRGRQFDNCLRPHRACDEAVRQRRQYTLDEDVAISERGETIQDAHSQRVGNEREYTLRMIPSKSF
ncbi:hypothetical protein FQZ97_1082580 [compost metagenome]